MESQFWDSISRNSSEFFPTKFLRISPEYFSGNSREILRTMFTDFQGNLLRELVSRNSWEFLQNFTPRKSWEFLLIASLEISEKFLGLGHHVYEFLGEWNKKISFEKFLRISLKFSQEILRFSSQNFQVQFFSNRCLWVSLLLCTDITKFFFFASLLIKNDNLLQSHLLKKYIKILKHFFIFSWQFTCLNKQNTWQLQ